MYEITAIKDGGIYYKHSFTTFKQKVFIVDDEAGLAKFLAANPLSTDIEGDIGRMATRNINSVQPGQNVLN